MEAIVRICAAPPAGFTTVALSCVPCGVRLYDWEEDWAEFWADHGEHILEFLERFGGSGGPGPRRPTWRSGG